MEYTNQWISVVNIINISIIKDSVTDHTTWNENSLKLTVTVFSLFSISSL